MSKLSLFVNECSLNILQYLIYIAFTSELMHDSNRVSAAVQCTVNGTEFKFGFYNQQFLSYANHRPKLPESQT